MYKSIALLLICSLLVVHADFQFLLTAFNSLSDQYVQFQHISRIPSSNDTYLVSQQFGALSNNYSFGLASYSSLTYTPLELTYNGEKICCTQSTQQWVEYPKEAPEFVYTTAVTFRADETGYLTVSGIRLLKIATASQSVVLATTLLPSSTTVLDITAMDVSPDGTLLYAITVDAQNSTLTVFSTADFTVTQTLNLQNSMPLHYTSDYGGAAYVAIAAGVEKLYVVSSYYILAMNRATLTVQQNFSMYPDMDFGPTVRLDEANDSLFVTTHESGYFKYGFIYNLTKLSLDPLELVATVKPEEEVGEAEYILIDDSRNVVYYAMRGYYTNTQQLFTLDIESFALINSTYLPGYTSVGTFSNSSKNELFIAASNILGRLAIEDNVQCDYPIITSSLTSSRLNEFGSYEYTFTATIYNPSSSAITELRLSANCSNAARAGNSIQEVSAYNTSCSNYYRLPAGAVIVPHRYYDFTYVKEYSNVTSDFKIEYINCGVASTNPTNTPTTTPTTAPTNTPTTTPTNTPTTTPTNTPTSTPTNTPTTTPTTPPTTPPSSGDCSSVSIEQSIQTEWQQNGVRDAVYNVFFANSGSVKITSLIVTAGSGINSLWGLDSIGNGQYRLPAYGVLEAGSRYSWGYIREGEGPATFTLSGCTATQPTQAPVTSPDFPISLSQTASSTWSSNGQLCQQVDVRIKNTSPSTTLTSVKLSSPDFANVQQSWNIVKDANNNLVLPSYVTSLAPGATFLFGYVNCGSLVHFQIAAAN